MAKGSIFYEKKTLNIRGNLVDLSTPRVMGILNVTPDSFYDGGRYFQNEQRVLQQAEKMLSEGATFLDIGGYSSRPGAEEVSVEEEKRRVVENVALVTKHFPEAYVSVDTFRAEVAHEAVAAGAGMVNDISGGELDQQMFDTIAELQVPYILMHMRGTPQTMQGFITYENLVVDVLDDLQKKMARLRELKVKDIIVDPGFGFAKTIDQNYTLLKNLSVFLTLRAPLLVGLSRKSMIYRRLNIDVEAAGNGTTVLNTLALMKGAGILRVHDVKEAVEAIKLVAYYRDA